MYLCIILSATLHFVLKYREARCHVPSKQLSHDNNEEREKVPSNGCQG